VVWDIFIILKDPTTPPMINLITLVYRCCVLLRLRQSLILIFLHLFLINVQAQIQVELPGGLTNFKPKPTPIAPGDLFNMPKLSSGNPKNETPSFAEWTRTAGAGESVVISGVNFTIHNGNDAGKDVDFLICDGSGNQRHAAIQLLYKDGAIITVDDKCKKWGMYLIWASNDKGYGRPLEVNKTEAWWLGNGTLEAGSEITVYGRNLAHENDTISSFGYLIGEHNTALWLKTVEVNPYKVTFKLPGNLVDGNYKVWMHNGHGGEYGWSKPLDFKIKSINRSSTAKLNVRDFGASGNGISDDTRAIQATIAATENKPGTIIYFPRGTYVITNTIFVRDNIKIQGEEKSRTTIKCANSFSKKASGMLKGSVTNFSVENITFDTDGNLKGEHSNGFFLRGSNNVMLRNVKMTFQGFDILNVDQSRSISILNCEIVGKITFLGSSSEILIDHCKFYLTDDAEMAIDSWGGTRISVTNSTCEDFDNRDVSKGRGWGKGRFFTARGDWGSSRYIYIGKNTTSELGARPYQGVDQNSGEQLLWEGYTTEWCGSPTSSSLTVTTFPKISKTVVPTYIAVIVSGRGIGQSRIIKSVATNKIILETPWNVQPDGKSIIAIGRFADKVAVYKNTLNGKQSAVDNDSLFIIGSTGIQPYGGIFNFIADNNQISSLRSGLANWATQHLIGVDPNYFSLYVNNKISNCRWGIQNGLNNVNKTNPVGTGMLATTYRNNSIFKSNQSGIIYSVSDSSPSDLDYFLYEFNNFHDVKNGHSLGGDLGSPGWLPKESKGINTVLLYRNIFESSHSSSSAMKLTKLTRLRQNSYLGWKNVSLNTTHNPILEAPYHVVSIEGSTDSKSIEATLDLWNSGAEPIIFTSLSTAKWLTISNAYGEIKAESDSYSLKLIANPLGLTQGNHEAEIEIRYGLEVDRFTVKFTVNSPTTICNVTLPLYGKRSDDKIHLVTVIKDLLTQDPQVEYSNNSTCAFSPLSPQPSFRVISGKYEMTIKSLDSVTTYYRLKSVTVSGCELNSNSIAIKGLFGRNIISVFPVPTQDVLNLKFSWTKLGPIILNLFSSGGQRLHNPIYLYPKSEKEVYPIPLPFIYRGTYFLKVIFPNKEAKTVKLFRS